MDVTHEPPRKPKSGFAREKVKRLAAEARASEAEAKLRALGAAMSDGEQIQTQETEQAEDQIAGLRSRYGGLADAVVEGAMTLEAALVEADKRDSKPNSGYARKRIALIRALAEKDRLEAELSELQRDHEKLEAAFSELLKLHNSLLEDLKARQHPLPSFLMGRAHV
jgi:chromosome segregation ATPase